MSSGPAVPSASAPPRAPESHASGAGPAGDGSPRPAAFGPGTRATRSDRSPVLLHRPAQLYSLSYPGRPAYSGRRDDAEELEQTELIEDAPALGQLAIRDAHDVQLADADGLASRRDVAERPIRYRMADRTSRQS